MILETLGLLFALGALIVLPGWLLVHALFPRPGELGAIERGFLVVAGGILVTMTVGILLGFLPHGERGALQSIATRGMPNVELAMIGVCLTLFYIGVKRGAYRTIRARYPRLADPFAKPASQAEQQP